MGFLGKLFGSGADIEKLRQALEQNRYAEAVHLAEDLSTAGEESEELCQLQVAALDGLAQLNLEEGERFLAAGDLVRGAEHLQLAVAQARTPELVEKIESVLVQGSPVEAAGKDSSDVAPSVATSCGSCAPAPQPAPAAVIDLPDQETQLELILASYPPDLQQRYLERSSAFLQAFMLVHEGEDQQALDLWLQLPEAERAGLYLFELGCLYGRLGTKGEGVRVLQQALELESGNLLVIDSLLALLLEQGEISGAQELLQQQLAGGADSAFCHARLCELQLQAQETDAAFASARMALDAGFSEPGFLVMAAMLFEQAGQVEDAEQLLISLPAGGCSGGVNLHLAEFWLRQSRELGRILDAFNGACRQEPDNPRWQLRVAQTYLARNWSKQGLELLQRVVGDPRLEESLRLEAQQLLAGG